MKRQRARPSRSPGWLAAALKASWPPLSTSTFSTHSVMTSGERSLPMPCGLRSPHLAGGGTAGDARHEFGGARDHGAAVAVYGDHVVAVVQQHQLDMGLAGAMHDVMGVGHRRDVVVARMDDQDRKSTRLNSSHSQKSYAVFCLKKKKMKRTL